jgi:hypothetical protein
MSCGRTTPTTGCPSSVSCFRPKKKEVKEIGHIQNMILILSTEKSNTITHIGNTRLHFSAPNKVSRVGRPAKRDGLNDKDKSLLLFLF